jgi:hypothetical protein
MVPRDPTRMWTFARKGQHTIPLFLFNRISQDHFCHNKIFNMADCKNYRNQLIFSV